MPRYSFESDEGTLQNDRPAASQYYAVQPTSYVPATEALETTFDRLRSARQFSNSGFYTTEPENMEYPSSDYMSQPPPPPPPHRDLARRSYVPEPSFSHPEPNTVTPGADNFSEQASGGMAGIARTVAEANARESGVQAMRQTPGYALHDDPVPYDEDSPYLQSGRRQEHSSSSLLTLGGAAASLAGQTPTRSQASFATSESRDSEHRYSRPIHPAMGPFDPGNIEDDGDDGLEYKYSNGRASVLSFAPGRSREKAAQGAAAGGMVGSLGSLVGRAVSGAGRSKDTASGQYGPVGHRAYDNHDGYDMSVEGEKSDWLQKQKGGIKKHRCIVGGVIGFIVIAAIIGGIVGGVLSSRSTSPAKSSASAASDTATNGNLTKDSAEIQALMNNKNLHQVFPGMDYTPMNTQYPDCLNNPPSQNNVTRDLAVLAQLTNKVRLYGTDCNQTEMLLHSIDVLDLNSTVKVWLGVWQGDNQTTNTRQLSQMYTLLDTYGADPFAGIIVGNEVLFREDMTAGELGTVLSDVKSNLTSLGIDLKVASSDLGDDWTSALASDVDVVMANIHPFFAGVTADAAANWTWSFWNQHDIPLATAAGSSVGNIISETGWPSGGGTDCGGATSCTVGSVAGVDEMNTFMADWVCQALTNGTEVRGN